MTDAAKSSFVYVTYIRTTPEELWAALTTPEFMKKYWFGMKFDGPFAPGALCADRLEYGLSLEAGLSRRPRRGYR